MNETVLPAGAGPVDGTVRPAAEATETAMRNFALDCAYGGRSQMKASADALRAAVHAEVAAERERHALHSNPVAYYDGVKFYGSKEAASMDCADMAALKPLYATSAGPNVGVKPPAAGRSA